MKVIKNTLAIVIYLLAPLIVLVWCIAEGIAGGINERYRRRPN